MTEAIPSSKAKKTKQSIDESERLGTISAYIWNYLSSNREQEMKKFTLLFVALSKTLYCHKPNKKGLPRKQKCKRSNPNESQMWFLADDSLHSYLQLFFITRTFAYKLFFVSFTLSFCYYVSPVSGLQFAYIILFEYVLNMHQFPSTQYWFGSAPLSSSFPFYIEHFACMQDPRNSFLFRCA